MAWQMLILLYFQIGHKNQKAVQAVLPLYFWLAFLLWGEGGGVEGGGWICTQQFLFFFQSSPPFSTPLPPFQKSPLGLPPPLFFNPHLQKKGGGGTDWRVKVLEDLEGDSVNPAILHNSKINSAYNPVNNRNIEPGMMPGRKDMPKTFEAHQQNVEVHQAPVLSFHNIRNDDNCSDIKEMLPSA